MFQNCSIYFETVPKTKEGLLLNADVNGSSNIARKAFPEKFENVDLSFLAKNVDAVNFRNIIPLSKTAQETHDKKKTEGTLKQKKKICIRHGTSSHSRHEYRKKRRMECTVGFASKEIIIRDDLFNCESCKSETVK